MRSLLLAVVVAAAASGLGAQAPRIQTLGSFPWDGSTGSVLLQRVYIYALPAKSGADVAPSPSAEPVTPLIAQPRLIRWPLSDGIQAVTLMDQQTFLKVDLAGQSVPESRGATALAPSPNGLQVWVLRKDGTVVPHRSPLREAAWGSMGGWATRSQELTFAHARFQDLAGVIVRVNGKLLVREISSR